VADLSDGPNACCAEEQLLACCEDREKADCCGRGERCGCDLPRVERQRTAPIVHAGEPTGERA
jgi:hypothetical protein